MIEVADRLIKHSTNRIPVEFSTIHAPGEPVKLVKFAKPEDEAEAVGMDIEKLVHRENVPPREIAVFYRANDMSRLIEQSLAKRQIPYQVIGSGSYYDRMEVKDVLSMLRFLLQPERRDQLRGGSRTSRPRGWAMPSSGGWSILQRNMISI